MGQENVYLSLLLYQYVKEKRKEDREGGKQKTPLQIHERKTNYWNNLCFLTSSQNSFRTKFPKLGSPMQTLNANSKSGLPKENTSSGFHSKRPARKREAEKICHTLWRLKVDDLSGFLHFFNNENYVSRGSARQDFKDAQISDIAKEKKGWEPLDCVDASSNFIPCTIIKDNLSRNVLIILSHPLSNSFYNCANSEPPTDLYLSSKGSAVSKRSVIVSLAGGVSSAQFGNLVDFGFTLKAECGKFRGLCSEDEERLVRDLFRGYNKLIRPVQNMTEKVHVNFGLAFVQLINVNEKNQIMKSNVWLRFIWTDYQLQWDEADYGGIGVLRLPPDKVWKPDIVLFNNADGNYEVRYKSNVLIYPNGDVLWVPPAIYQSSCTIDVTYFPFDQQTCIMKFGSWTFNGDQTEDLVLHGESHTTDRAHLLSLRAGVLPSGRGWRESDAGNQHSALVGRVSVTGQQDSATDVAGASVDRQIPSVHLHHEHGQHPRHRDHHQLELPRAEDPQNAAADQENIPQVSADAPADEATEENPAQIPNVTLPTSTYSGSPTELPKHLPSSLTKSKMEVMELSDLHHPNCKINRKVHHTTSSSSAAGGEGLADRRGSESSDSVLLSPEASKATEAVEFIAEHLRNEDLYIQTREDWKYVAMVIDRLQLYIFFLVTSAGTIGILMDAPHIFEYVDQDRIIEIYRGNALYDSYGTWNESLESKNENAIAKVRKLIFYRYLGYRIVLVEVIFELQFSVVFHPSARGINYVALRELRVGSFNVLRARVKHSGESYD
ncbi:Acetylcholine receptor subunit beta-like 1 [Melipona quadrifasciata]|uniref:Acetylcholine receptor subunit beta-like 1 n=1 Tax=Melipona quadrifasciata TaxID=166423 RepID=A0A0M8ZUT0_9HYME|nr:Acetylcholine receptor subunit beta-like 1 [Melipona quadrifasciata]